MRNLLLILIFFSAFCFVTTVIVAEIRIFDSQKSEKSRKLTFFSWNGFSSLANVMFYSGQHSHISGVGGLILVARGSFLVFVVALIALLITGGF